MHLEEKLRSKFDGFMIADKKIVIGKPESRQDKRKSCIGLDLKFPPIFSLISQHLMSSEEPIES